MGCVFGESHAREGTYGTSNTLRSDVSWVGTGERLERGARTGTGWGVKRKMTRGIYCTQTAFMSSLLFKWKTKVIQYTGRNTEMHWSTWQKKTYICIHVNEYVQFFTHMHKKANKCKLNSWRSNTHTKTHINAGMNALFDYYRALSGPVPRGDTCQCDCHCHTDRKNWGSVEHSNRPAGHGKMGPLLHLDPPPSFECLPVFILSSWDLIVFEWTPTKLSLIPFITQFKCNLYTSHLHSKASIKVNMMDKIKMYYIYMCICDLNVHW